LPAELPGKMLLLSAGSGITPVMAMLRDLQGRRYPGDVVFLHVCHAPGDLIFARQLAAIAGEFAELSLVLHYSATEGRFSRRRCWRWRCRTLRSAAPGCADPRDSWMQ
jgi:ferredoxin-NADP reductase